ncbi:MAG: efflux RND transporter periplasmic adaptor subunit [Bacteroidales bacterium]|nr:efflux RND transporter periplasmic adaptor subunit [Bacteroidales bacterium]
MKNILFIITAYLLLSCSTEESHDAHEHDAHEHEAHPEDIVELTHEQVKVAGIEFGSPEQRNISDALRLNGIVAVTPQNMITMSAPMGGFVKSTEIMEGSSVKKGQVLAVIENPDLIELEEEYLETRSKYEYAEAEFKRHTQLHSDEVYSTKNLQEITANYKGLKSQMNAAFQKLKMIGVNPSQLNEDNISGSISLVAPVNGYIRNVNLNVGKYVTQSDALFEIINTNSLLIELTLFEKDLRKIKPGQKIMFSLPNESSGKRQAEIIQVGKAVANDKSIKAYASFKQNDALILPGMFVNASIETGSVNVQALPSQAIIRFDEKDYVFIFERDKMENNKPFTEYKMIEVKTGITENGFTEIVFPEGFDAPKEKIVVKGAYNLMAAKKNEGEMSC